MTRKTKGKRFLDDESDLEELGREGNPNARERRERVVFPQMPRWLYRVILILLISVAGLLVWFNRDNLSPQNIGGWIQSKVVGMGVGDGYPAALDNGRNVAPGNFFAADKNVVVVSDTSITMLNSTAKELARRQHSFSNPVAKAWGQRVLVYNLGGTGYQVESISKAGERRIADSDILAGAISGNGRVALATESQGYHSRMTVYQENGKAFYTYDFSEYYITHIALNRSGTRAAVAGVAAKNGAMVSVVYLFDFGSPKPVSQLTYQDNLVLSLDYGQNGAIVAVGDQLTSVISENGEKTDYGYGSQSYLGSAVDNGRTALLLAPYANADSASLVLVDAKGKQTASVPMGQKAESISLYGDTAAVLLSDETIHAYTASGGAQKGACSGGKDARALTLRDESSVYVLGFSEIRLEHFAAQQEQNTAQNAAGSAVSG
ncbi:DUF5711 family protein [Faecalispora anaeroviscerum]|uniref:DUF5711 family protein n=1 Tax=Faecalispora anaeroviscerum TaxID=2991836 RepID=UPI0024BBB5B2|nr:DUF5711 family protein [Faecalispora anaeroviscerum]